MEAFLLKMVICTGLLLAVYILFLEKERMHRFKRFYLLFSLLFAMAIPLLTVEVPAVLAFVAEKPAQQQAVTSLTVQYTEVTYQQVAATTNPVIEQPKPITKEDVLLYLYITISTILLVRYMLNLLHLALVIRRNKTIKLKNATLVLVADKIVPHSFLHYIFVNKTEYENRIIEDEVLAHELTHVRQRHSADILFIELLLIFLWFNPILFMYRNKMKLNHEFLADEGVISRFTNIPQYQLLLVSKAARNQNLLFTSDLNYSLTKKRLIMMTKITSARIALLKKAVLLPLFLLFAFAFCTKKVSGQVKEKTETATYTNQQEALLFTNESMVKILTTAETPKDFNIKLIDKEIFKDENGNRRIDRAKLDYVRTENEEMYYTLKEYPHLSVIISPIPESKLQDEEVVSKKTIQFTPPVIVKDEKNTLPPPTMSKIPDLSGKNVGDTITDSRGNQWVITSLNPTKLQTSPPTPLKTRVQFTPPAGDKKTEKDKTPNIDLMTYEGVMKMHKTEEEILQLAEEGLIDYSKIGPDDLIFIETKDGMDHYAIKDNSKVKIGVTTGTPKEDIRAYSYRPKQK